MAMHSNSHVIDSQNAMLVSKHSVLIGLCHGYSNAYLLSIGYATPTLMRSQINNLSIDRAAVKSEI